MGFLRYIEYCR